MSATLNWPELNAPVRYLKGIGPARAEVLGRVGVVSILDLLYYFPRTYQDRTQFRLISTLRDGEMATILGSIRRISETRPRRGLHLLKVLISDGKGQIEAVWFNQPYLKKQFTPGADLILSGRVSRRFGPIQLTAPDWELVDEDNDSLHSGRIVPIYPLTAGLTQRALRRKMKEIVDQIAPQVPEFLPTHLVVTQGLLPLPIALRQIHFPDLQDGLEKARKRFLFEELFLLQLGFARRWKERKSQKGISFRTEGDLVQRFLSELPFALTDGQQQSLQEIEQDMHSSRPMNRLLQGEVGSGKTVLAAYAMLVAVQNGYQAALMAPTEILAGQHYLVLQQLFRNLPIQVALLTAGRKGAQRVRLREELEDGSIQILIGTHALLEEGVNFRRLGLVVIDEQHKFGVMQRKILKEKAENPDVLVLTATPIPRSLALTLYGDFDLSTIRGLPANRQPITTYLVSGERKTEVYQFIRREVQTGRQVYIVCPRIESKEGEDERGEAAAATKLKEELQRDVFPEFHLGLLHGRMTTTDKDRVMADFKDNQIQILVSTTVIEVGIDVANATLIAILDADRFGLAQLHQLRGRVGRGCYKSYCVLMANPKSEEAMQRLDVMVRSNDGFVISSEDLKIRGPGEFFGTLQHGAFQLRFADLFDPTTYAVLDQCRQIAFDLAQRPPSEWRQFPLLEKMLQRRFPFDGQRVDVS